MQQILQNDINSVDEMAEERLVNLVEWTLESFEDKIADRAETIEDLFCSTDKRREAVRAVMEFVTNEVELATDGSLCVVDYSQKSMAKQTFFLYLGSHWDKVIPQQIFDFVKRSAKKMGLPDLYCNDQDFMNKVFERLAFRVMQHRQMMVKKGEIWINLQNCTLEIKKDGSLNMREHRKEDFFTYVLPFAYNSAAKCPMWHSFLDRVLPEIEMQKLLAEGIGYCFTKDLKLEKMMVFYGTGCNGKSVCLDVIAQMMGGMHNVSNMSLSSITNDDEKRAHIEHKLVNISHESGGNLDCAMLKQLVSGEPTEVRRLYVGSHTMVDYAKFITSYNTLPRAENTFGFFRRWILFPFDVTIPEVEQDVDLTPKLCTELSGIFNWVLDALKDLLVRKTFTKSERCTEAINDYKRHSRSANEFFYEKCELSKSTVTKLVDIYNAYVQFCKDEDIQNRSGKKAFQDAIKALGAVATVKHNTIYYNVVFKEVGNE